MKEMRSIMENYILKHDRNKRILAAFLALAILVSFAVPASLIQPANSMTNDDGSNTPVVLATGVSRPANDSGYFENPTYEIPDGATDFSTGITDVTVSPGTESDGSITIVGGSSDSVDVQFTLAYTLDSDTLTKDNPCIYYQLPEGVTVPSAYYGSTMRVIDAEYSRTIPSGYYSINEDGLIVIQFTDAYIDYLSNSDTYSGTIRFNGNISRDDSASGDQVLEIGGLKIVVTFDDVTNGVYKSASVTNDGNGNVTITWKIEVTNYGYGIDGWTLSDDKFASVGVNNITVSPDIYGSFNADGSYTFASTCGENEKVTFTYSETITEEELNQLYKDGNTKVSNVANFTDGTVSVSSPAEVNLNGTSINKIGDPDYKTGDYNNSINWEVVLSNPYGASLEGYQISDTMITGNYLLYNENQAMIGFTDENGNALTWAWNEGEVDATAYDILIDRGTGVITVNKDVSKVVLNYTARADNTNTWISNTVSYTYPDSDKGSNTSASVYYEKQMNLEKKGAYDAENGCVVWTITAKANVGELNGYYLTDAAFSTTSETGFDFSKINVLYAYDSNSNTWDLTSLSNNGSVISLGKNGTEYGTITYDTSYSNGSLRIDSADANGLTEVRFTYTTSVTDEQVNNQATVSNQISDNHGNSVEEDVTLTNPYSINKTGKYSAETNSIIWTVEVENTALSNSTLGGMVLTDDAFAKIDPLNITIVSAEYNGAWFNPVTSSVLGDVVSVQNDGTTYGTMTLEGGTVTFANAEGYGISYIKFTYSTTVTETENNNGYATNEITTNKGVEDETDQVPIVNPYVISKAGYGYDQETGYITWKVDLRIGQYDYTDNAGTLNGVVLTDEALKGLLSSNFEVLSGKSAYGWTDLKEISREQISDTKFVIHVGNGDTEYGTVIVDTESKTLSFTSTGDKGIRLITFTYKAKATDAEISSGSATNTIGTYPGAAGPTGTGVGTQGITMRNEISKTFKGNADGKYSETVYGDDSDIRVLNWEINLTKDGGYTGDTYVLVDSLSATNGGAHYITQDQIDDIVVNAKVLSGDGYTTLVADTHYNVTFYSDAAGTVEITEWTDTTVALSYKITFTDAVNTAGYRYVNVAYKTSADVSGVTIDSGEDYAYATFGNTANFGGNTSSGGSFGFTRYPAEYTEYTSVNVKKIWTDNSNALDTRDESITVQLQQSTDGGATWTNYGEAVTLTGSVNTWTQTFTDLPKKVTSTDENGVVTTVNYVYRVVETSYDADYSTTYGNNSGVNSGDIYIYNQLNSITVNKTWNNGSGTVYDASTGSVFTTQSGDITINVYRRLKGSSDEWELVQENKTVSSGYTFVTNIAYEYYIEEIVPDGYAASYENSLGTADSPLSSGTVKISNTLNKITVNKQWNDNNNTTYRTDTITVDIYRRLKGETGWDLYIADVEFNASSGYSFITDPAYEYYVEEHAVDGYDSSSSPNSANPISSGSITITNTLRSITVNKSWQNDTEGDRPSTITVQLYQALDDGQNNWVKYGDEVTLQSSSNWSYTWSGLPTSTSPGAYIYKVEEISVDGYKTTYTNNSGISTGTIGITNTKADSVDKIAYDKDGNALANGATIKTENLITASINGESCYLLMYRIYPNRGGITITDNIPTGWKFREYDNNDTGYAPFSYYNQYRSDQYYSDANSGYIYTVDESGNGTVTFNYTSTRFEKQGSSYIQYYIYIPVSELDASSAVEVSNTATPQGGIGTTNKVVISDSGSSGGEVGGGGSEQDNSLLNKNGNETYDLGVIEYTIVVNPDGKNLSNGETIDIIDDFDLLGVTGLTEQQIAALNVSLVDISVQTVEVKDDGTYTVIGPLDSNEFKYVVESKPTETVSSSYSFYLNNNMTDQWMTTDCVPGDEVTLVATYTSLEAMSNNPYLAFNWNQGISDYTVTEDTDALTKTYKFTVPSGATSLHHFYYNQPGYTSSVTATVEKEQQTATSRLTVTLPDETALLLTYYYYVPGLKGGDIITANNEASLNTGNASASDTTGITEFVVTDTGATSAANAPPTIHKVNISDYSVQVDAQFMFAYYDSSSGNWVFAADATANSSGHYEPDWELDDGTRITATGNNIPNAATETTAGAYIFTLGEIQIAMDTDKLYKLVEVTVPSDYLGDNILSDFKQTLTEYNSGNYAGTYTSYIEAYTSAYGTDPDNVTFLNMLQLELTGTAPASPYDYFFDNFVSTYYFAYSEADYTPPSDFTGTVTEVRSAGDVSLTNNQLIEVSATKSWDATLTEGSLVSSQIELYWSYTKKTDGSYPDTMYLASKENLGLLEDIDNPKSVGINQTASWDDLPGGIGTRPIYYYVKEAGYTIDGVSYRLMDGVYVKVNADKQPIDANGEVTTDKTKYVLGEYKPIFTGNGGNSNETAIKIVNTKGMTLRKVWKDSDGNLDTDLEYSEITVTLFGVNGSNRTDLGEYTLTKTDNWECPLPDNINYSQYASFDIVESANGNKLYGYVVSVTSNINDNTGLIEVTNKDKTPTQVDVKVDKIWADGSANHENDEITVNVYRTTTKQDDFGVGLAQSTETPYATATLNAANGWTYTWSGETFPYSDENGNRYRYYVVEETVDGYSAIYQRNEELATHSTTITNYKPGSLEIEKQWETEDGAAINGNSPQLPESIQVDIYQVIGEETSSSLADDVSLNILATGDSITYGYMTPEDAYTETLQPSLDKIYSQVTVKNNGHNNYQITHIEDTLDGLLNSSYNISTVIAGTNNLIGTDQDMDTMKNYMISLIDRIYELAGSEHIVFLGGVPRYTACESWARNTYVQPGDADAQEKWDTLIGQYNDMLKGLVNDYTNQGHKIYYVDIYSAVGNLLNDDGVHPSTEGYEKIAEAFYSAINAHYGVTTSSGLVLDANNKPDVSGLTPYRTETLNEGNNWQVSLTDLPKMNSQNVPYLYYVVEKTSGYTTKYSANGLKIGEDSQTITVTNTIEAETTTIIVNKTWQDGGANRPSSIALTLQRSTDRVNWSPVTANISWSQTNGNTWVGTYSGLDVYDELGNPYYYKVVESALDGYLVTYAQETGVAATGTTEAERTLSLTNTKVYDLEVEKVWSDGAENHTGDEVTIEIHRVTVVTDVPELPLVTEGPGEEPDETTTTTTTTTSTTTTTTTTTQGAVEGTTTTTTTANKLNESTSVEIVNDNQNVTIPNGYLSKSIKQVQVYFRDTLTEFPSWETDTNVWFNDSSWASVGETDSWTYDGRVATWGYKDGATNATYFGMNTSRNTEIEMIVVTYTDGSTYTINNTAYVDEVVTTSATTVTTTTTTQSGGETTTTAATTQSGSSSDPGTISTLTGSTDFTSGETYYSVAVNSGLALDSIILSGLPSTSWDEVHILIQTDSGIVHAKAYNNGGTWTAEIVSGGWQNKDKPTNTYSGYTLEVKSNSQLVLTFSDTYSASEVQIATYGQGSNVGAFNVNYTITYATVAPANYMSETTSTFSLRSINVMSLDDGIALAAETDDTYVATITLSSTNGWKDVYANLPVYDENGNLYYYWIEEVDVGGYTPAYEFGSGLGYVTGANGNASASVTNTKNDISSTLPSTGGEGTTTYYIAGIGIMLCALAGIYGFKRRREES